MVQNFYVPAVTLSIHNNAKLLKQLKFGLKRTINCNKYQLKKSTNWPNHCLDFIIDLRFQGVSRLFVLLCENEAQRISYKRYYHLTREINNHNVMIDWQYFFDQAVRNDLITYGNIRKIATDQGDDYTTACLLDYNYL